MKASQYSLVLSTVLMATSAALASACGAASSEQEGGTGTLSMPLIATAASGTVFRLRTATFQISGMQSASANSETDPDATELHFELKAGGYVIRLKTGWSMERSLDGGLTYTPVKAVLTSANPAPFNITDQGATTVAFEFNAGEDVVQLGNGSLIVKIDVNDTDAPDEPAFPVNVDGLSPEATGLLINGGGIAAHDGFTYVEEFPGSDGTNGRIFKVAPDGSINQNFITNVVAGFKPALSHAGTLLVTGNDFGTPRIDEYALPNGAFLGNRFMDPGAPFHVTTADERPDSSFIFGTDTTVGGIRLATDPFTSAKISDGIGNNVFVDTTSDGTVFVGSGSVLGVVVGGGVVQHLMNTAGPSITSVVVLPDDAMLASTAPGDPCFGPVCVGSVLFSSDQFNTWTELVTTGTGGFRSMAYDSVTDEVVVVRSDGNLYRISL